MIYILLEQDIEYMQPIYKGVFKSKESMLDFAKKYRDDMDLVFSDDPRFTNQIFEIRFGRKTTVFDYEEIDIDSLS
jgi:hypothetical protein